MRAEPVTESMLEWAADRCGLVPRPFIATFHGPLVARCLMIATKLGVFEGLEFGPKTSEVIAEAVGTHPLATEKLLNVLVAAKYLRHDGRAYSLSKVSRKWLLKSSPTPLRDNVILRFLEWGVFDNLENFVMTGQQLDIHGQMTEEHWGIYQRGMKSLARMSAPEIVARTPVPKGATRMLDIGGSHGFYSVGLCRKHPGLSSVILDLPQAVTYAAPLLAEENMGDRVVHRPGNALTDDLGESQWDLVFISQLLHHFTTEQIRELMARVTNALKPGGVLACVEVLRQDSPQNSEQTGTVFDMFFAATSQSGTWPVKDLQAWQRGAGLTPLKPRVLFSAPVSIVAARKG